MTTQEASGAALGFHIREELDIFDALLALRTRVDRMPGKRNQNTPFHRLRVMFYMCWSESPRGVDRYLDGDGAARKRARRGEGL